MSTASPRPPAPARPTRRGPDYTPINERTLRKVLAWITANAEHRTGGGSYGEVTVRFAYAAGKITQARLVEETIIKPDE